MAFENFPYANFHELNLDWILERVKEAYSASNPPDYPVKSVNGMTGDVIIAVPSNLVQSVNGETGVVVLYRNPLVQFPPTDEQRWNLFRICDGDERGIEFDEDGAHRIEGTRRILIYDEENQPDFPVTSVNGQTGDVRIVAGVNSVNGKTGNVVTPFVNPNTDILKLDSNSNTVLWGISRDVAGGNVALYISRGTGTPQAFIRYTPDQGEAVNLPLLSSADIPEDAGVVSVNSKTGVVTLYGTNILLDDASAYSIKDAINNANFYIDAINDSIFTVSPGVVSQWSRRIYSPGNGGNETASRHIRIDTDLSAKCSIIKSTNGNLLFFLCAWDNENNWMGLYDPATGLFSPYQTTLSSLVNLTMRQINVADVQKAYPAYRFRIMARYADNTNIDTDEAANIEFYELNIDSGTSPDISELQETVAGHTTQISALQAANLMQDQRLSALESNDDTQDQQISALQAVDSTHAQQIAELQSNDTTHNQQISDLYNASVTQGNQINDLYTRTGIYTIYIENVNSLPLRYPASGTDAKIKSTNMVVSMDMNIPGVQVNDWTITTYDGYLEITGTLNGTVTLTLYLA